MSEEVLYIVKANREKAETQVALQCAPLLAGMKISNLLSVASGQRETIQGIFKKTGISCHVLYENDEKVTFLLYDEKKLQRYLRSLEIRKIMEGFGYQNESLESMLDAVAVRYTGHMREGAGFPHEIGILLGYPARDVMGFIENRGDNFLYSGYWKVYGDLMEALRTFKNYEWAREKVIRLVNQGVRIEEILVASALEYPSLKCPALAP